MYFSKEKFIKVNGSEKYQQYKDWVDFYDGYSTEELLDIGFAILPCWTTVFKSDIRKDNIVNSGDNTNKNSSEETAIYSSYVGNWYDSKDDTKVMTVNSDGSITIDGIGKITNITKKSDTNFVMRYSKTQSGVTVTIIYDIKFSNSNSGTIDVTTIASGTTTPSGTINIVKK